MQLAEIQISIYPDGRLDTINASIYLGSSQKTMATHRSNGTGPVFIKRGGRVFYYREDLDAWLNQSGKIISTSQYEAQKK